jgi:hypothetical protein
MFKKEVSYRLRPFLEIITKFKAELVKKKQNIKLVMKIIFFACLLTLIIISAIAVVVNILDVSTPFLNPPSPTVSQFISIDYPSATGLVFNATPVVHININLTTSGAFVQGQIVNLDAAGTISQSLIGNLSKFMDYNPIIVSFEGASQVINGRVTHVTYGEQKT